MTPTSPFCSSYLHLSLFGREGDVLALFQPAASPLLGKKLKSREAYWSLQGGYSIKDFQAEPELWHLRLQFSKRPEGPLQCQTITQYLWDACDKPLTPSSKAVNLKRELFQNRHRFISVMHLEEILQIQLRRRSGVSNPQGVDACWATADWQTADESFRVLHLYMSPLINRQVQRFDRHWENVFWNSRCRKLQ